MKKMMMTLVLLAGLWQGAAAQVDLQEVWRKPWTEDIGSAKFSVDGKYIYCASGNTIKKLDAMTGDSLSVFKNTAFLQVIYHIEISDDGNYLSSYALSKNSKKGLYLWDLQTESLLKEIKIPDQPDSMYLDKLHFFPDNQRCVFVLFHEPVPNLKPVTIIIEYNYKNDQVIHQFECPGYLAEMALSYDGTKLATGSVVNNPSTQQGNDQLLLWDTGTWKQVATLQDYPVTTGEYGYRLIKFSKDDKYLGSIRWIYDGPDIYNLSTNKMIKTSDGRACYSFDFLPDNNTTLAYYVNLGTEMFDYQKNSVIKFYNYIHAGIIESYKYSNNDTFIFVYGDTNRVLKLVPTGVSEQPINDEQVQINQMNNKIIITLTNPEISNVFVTISDLQGRLYYSETLNITSSYSIDVNLTSGIYLCTVNSSNKQHSKKIEIVR